MPVVKNFGPVVKKITGSRPNVAHKAGGEGTGFGVRVAKSFVALGMKTTSRELSKKLCTKSKERSVSELNGYCCIASQQCGGVVSELQRSGTATLR